MIQRIEGHGAPAEGDGLLLAVDAGDPERASGEERGREAAERRHDARADELQLPVEVRLAGCDLRGERVAVAGRPALEHRREVCVVEREADGSEQPLEELPRATGERPPVPVLVEPRRLAHEDEVRVRVPLAEDDLRAALGERAADAARGLGGRVAQR